MIVQTLRNWRELDELSQEWNNLLAASRSASIFQTWEWIQVWRSIAGESVTPFVIAVRGDDGQLIGIAPLYVANFRLLRTVKVRALRHMADVATGQDYPDWIVDQAHEEEAANAISEELAKQKSQWDLVWLARVPGWTGVEKRIIDSASRSGLGVLSRTRPFGAMGLPAEVAEFEASIPSRRRQQMRRHYRRIEKLAGVEFVRCESDDQLDEFLDALFDLHQRRWEAEGIDGCFKRRPAEAEFYRRFARLALSNGWLAMYAVLEHGVFKAVQFGYVYNGVFSQLQEGYDPDYQNGAGNALRLFVIRDCIHAGVKEYDFLAGMTEHKRRWSAEARDGYDIMIGSGSLRSRLIVAAGLWPTGRFLEQLGSVEND